MEGGAVKQCQCPGQKGAISLDYFFFFLSDRALICSLELMILLPQPLKHWDYRSAQLWLPEVILVSQWELRTTRRDDLQVPSVSLP